MATAGAGIPLAIDVNALAATKRLAKEDPRAAARSAAQQFEAAFLQMVLKAMRDASPQEGIFDSEQSRLYQSLLDQQLAQTMSAKGTTGLAALIEKQLASGLPPQAEAAATQAEPPGFNLRAPSAPLSKAAPQGTLPPAAPAAAPAPAGEFVGRLWDAAREASQATGIPAHFMIAQAALETGWGRSELRFADGTPTYNLFGIKAGRGWPGAVAEATTTEYVNGVPQKTAERFRAYGSYAEAFRDYARLLTSNPRYAAVLNRQDAPGFARGLQQAGYATDPMYAEKLTRIIGGQALRSGLVG